MLKKPYYFSILILFFIGCKSTELVKPSIISNANARDSEYNDEMLSQSNHLVHLFAK